MDLLSVKKEQIEDFLKRNRKMLVNPEYYYGVDNNQDSIEKFNDGHLKVLVVFMSTGETRSVSNTFNALYWLIKQGLGDKCFVDNCYFPEDANREIFQKEGIPYLFGNVSHHPITDYDLVLCSVAIMPEVFNIPHAWKNTGIPLTVEQRNIEKRVPPIIYGGAAANESAIILGHIYSDDGVDLGKSLIDIANYGYGEDILPELVKKVDEYRREHNLKDKPAFYEWLISNGILHDNLFFPQFYEWVYDTDKFTIKEIKKLEDRLPDSVEYHRIGSESFDGFPFKAFHLSGANADSHDIMISSGCSGSSSCCSFKVAQGTLIPTENGLVPIEDMDGKEFITTGLFDTNPKAKVFRQQCSDVYELTLSNGQVLRGDKDHKMLVVKEGSFVEKPLGDLTTEDVVLVKLGVDSFPEENPFIREDRKDCNIIEETLITKEEYDDWAKNSNEDGFTCYQICEGLVKSAAKHLECVPDYLFRCNMSTLEYYRAWLTFEWNEHPDFSDYSPRRKKFDSREEALKAQMICAMLGEFSKVELIKDDWYLLVDRYTEFCGDNGEIVSIEGLSEFNGISEYENLFKDRESDVYEAIKLGKAFPVKVESVKVLDYKLAMYDASVRGIPHMVYNMIYTHNCMEATVAGNYHERSLEDVEKDMAFVRRSCAPNTISWFSYNLNYFGHFMDLIKTGADYFAGTTLLNERMDIVANAPDQLRLAKQVGLKRFSGAIEGMGDRIRNHILNKNLSRETLMNAVRNVYALKLMHMKCVTPDTEVITPQGITKLGLLHVGDEVWSGSEYVKVTNICLNPVSRIMKLKLVNGMTIKGRPDHKVLNDFKWVELKDLNVGDLVMADLSWRSSKNRGALSLEEVESITFVEDDVTIAMEVEGHQYLTAGIVSHNCGLIATGQETEEDIDDFISEIDEMLSIREEMGANTSLQFNVTPMVFYSQIALRHLPRITSRMSFNNERTMGKLIEACQKRSIRIKFNGRGCGTWVEQLILDFGPVGTDALVDVTLNEGVHYYRHFGDKDKQRWLKVLTKRGYDPLFFIEARPKDWIFPNDHVNYVTDEVKKMWWERTEKMDFDTRLCLHTLANPNPKCHGCKMCDPSHIKKMVRRDFNDEFSLDEVLEALSDSRHVDTTRIVVRQNQEWDFYNRDSLSHYIASRILQANPDLEKEFYSVGKHSLSWESNNGQKCWFGGDWAFDINWKSRISESEITKVIDQINDSLNVCKIIRVFGDTKSLPIKRETEIAFLGQTTQYSMSQFKDKLSNFDWGIKVAVKSMGGGIDTETKYMPELKEKMLLVPHGHSILVYMSVPASVNPYLVMSSILGKSYDKMLQDFSFRVMDHGKEIDGTCSCGRHVTYSLLIGQNKRRCTICEGKMLLAKLTGQK